MLGKLNGMRVILATSSQQRQELLRRTVRDGATRRSAPLFLKILKFQRLKFEICASNFEENLDREQYTFSQYVEETAVSKVKTVYDKLKNEARKPDIIIGLDTMVIFDGKMYGKPKDEQDAEHILRTCVCIRFIYIWLGPTLFFN